MDWLDHDPVTRTIRLAQSYGNNARLPFGRGDAAIIDQSLAGHLQAVREAISRWT